MSLRSVIFFASLLLFYVDCKVYERCELANELKTLHKIPDKDLATWVCIARHESEYNTTAVGHLNWDGSGDHGLFQISDLYWCSPPGNGWACGVSCHQLEDDDIKDDVACIKRIHRQHQRLSGDGFSAWAVYRAHCSGDQVNTYIEGCFNKTEESDLNNEVIKSEEKKDDTVHTTAIKTDAIVKPAVVEEQNVVTSEFLVKPHHDFVKHDVQVINPVVSKPVVQLKMEVVKEDRVRTEVIKTEDKISLLLSDNIPKQGDKYDSVITTGRHFGILDKTKINPYKRVKLYEFGSNVRT